MATTYYDNDADLTLIQAKKGLLSSDTAPRATPMLLT